MAWQTMLPEAVTGHTFAVCEERKRVRADLIAKQDQLKKDIMVAFDRFLLQNDIQNADTITLFDEQTNQELKMQETINQAAQIQDRVCVAARAAQDKVKLDIGGKIVATTKAFLCSFKDSFFEAMLQSGRWPPGPDGSYFVDRTRTKGFDIMLHYMRTGQLHVQGLTLALRHQIIEEADFYGIKVPVQQLLQCQGRVVRPQVLKEMNSEVCVGMACLPQCGALVVATPNSIIISTLQGEIKRRWSVSLGTTNGIIKAVTTTEKDNIAVLATFTENNISLDYFMLYCSTGKLQNEHILLDVADFHRLLMVNDTQAIILANTRLYLMNFPKVVWSVFLPGRRAVLAMPFVKVMNPQYPNNLIQEYDLSLPDIAQQQIPIHIWSLQQRCLDIVLHPITKEVYGFNLSLTSDGRRRIDVYNGSVLLYTFTFVLNFASLCHWCFTPTGALVLAGPTIQDICIME